jgi:hypothetical protein
MSKTMTIGEIFPPSTLKEMEQEYERQRLAKRKELDPFRLANALRPIIEVDIERINVRTGQQNDPKYLAYAVAWAMTQPRNPR